jgi:MATE family multidrug resistance protein
MRQRNSPPVADRNARQDLRVHAPLPSVSDADPASHGTFSGLITLATPLILGMGATALMQFTDRWFLSQLGAAALAASFPAGVTAYCGQCLFSTAAAFTSTFAAQHFGAGESPQCGGWVWPALWFGLFGGVLMLAATPCLTALFSLMHPQPEVLHATASLCAWWLSCTLPASMLAAVGGFYAGTGRTAMVLAFNGCLLLLNAGLNALLIFGGLGLPALGAVGAGIGTFTATSLMALVAMACFLTRANRERFGTWAVPRWDAGRLWHFLSFAAPQGIRSLLEIGAWTFFTFAVGRLGTEALAANNIVINWNLLTFIPMVGLSQAIGVAVGQAIGGGRPERAVSATGKGVLLELGYAVIVGAALLLLRDQLILPFIHIEPAGEQALSAQRILVTSRHLLVVAALWGIGDALNLAYTGALNGAGDTRWPMCASLIGATTLLILPMVLVLSCDPAWWLACGIEPVVAAWLVTLLFVTVTGLAMALRFYFGGWRRASLRAGSLP